MFVLAEIAAAGLFAAVVGERVIGGAQPWYVFACVLIGFAIRAVDLENCALFLPGGAYGAAGQAFGKRASIVAASALLIDCVVLGAFAASAAGHSLMTGDDPATLVAVCAIGATWW